MGTPNVFPEFGAALRGARELRGLSQAKLAKLSGVSRRHIAAAEKGANITLLTVARLMRALDLTSISLAEDLAVTGLANALDPSVVVRLVDDLDEAVGGVRQRSGALRAYTTSRHAPQRDDRLSGRAGELLRGLTADLLSLDPATQVEVLERLMRRKKKEPTLRRRNTA